MRALIVDDEPLALECALAMIDWAAEGVRHVDTARSAAQAKELLARDGDYAQLYQTQNLHA